ncbi:MAG TPA: hypothetical protein VLG69_03780, partial [Candidatus Andersenbacteria bacterium]|nr:hypothetical protein [Candidatus Andersenbacteria bacterium]
MQFQEIVDVMKNRRKELGGREISDLRIEIISSIRVLLSQTEATLSEFVPDDWAIPTKGNCTRAWWLSEALRFCTTQYWSCERCEKSLDLPKEISYRIFEKAGVDLRDVLKLR